MFKRLIQGYLERSVRQFFRQHSHIKLIVVAGSIGKTSTKRAIATLLSQKYRVQMHEGNHNTPLSVPLAILGVDYPEDVHSVGAWWKVVRAVRERLSEASPFDVVVAELGADRPGDIAAFGRYLAPDIGVVTAVTPEHMEFFRTLDAVAREELSAANMSRLAIINRDDIDGKYAELLTNTNLDTYGTTAAAEYRYEIKDFEVDRGYTGSVITPEFASFLSPLKVVGEHCLRPVMGAVAVAVKMGLTPEEMKVGLQLIRPVPGRMNILRGMHDALIIDDTYNSSPLAASSALQTLYGLQAPQRIALLGDMNELGETSAQEHQMLGAMCDPSLLAWVITVGPEAEKHLAPAARARGCQVRSFSSAIDAGAFALRVIEPGAAILAKGSQGGIYMEEAVKVFAMLTEDDKLVRQTPAWLKAKADFFSKF